MALFSIGSGCTTTVIPPSNPANPTTVLIADYGRHSSLLLPNPTGGFTEYAFGDWEWFALGHTNAWAAFRALIGSPQSTLGRRWVHGTRDMPGFATEIGVKELQGVDVDSTRVDTLRATLEAEMKRDEKDTFYSEFARLYLVKSDRPYNLFHNCNHVTAEWLRELGAQTRGPCMFSSFKVLPPTPATMPSAATTSVSGPVS